MHPIWFPPPAWAATALQIQLAHPPSPSWPCATTTTPPPIDSKSIFCSKPCQTGMFLTFFFFFFFFFLIFSFFHFGPTPAPPSHYPFPSGRYFHPLAPLCAPSCPLR